MGFRRRRVRGVVRTLELILMLAILVLGVAVVYGTSGNGFVRQMEVAIRRLSDKFASLIP